MATRPPAPPDLSRPRTFGELLSTTFDLFGRHAAVFLTLALVLVTPATLLIDGVWGRALADGADAQAPVEASTASAALRLFVVLPIVTAANVLIVQSLAEGRLPTVTEALRAALRVFPPVVGAVVLYALAVLAGLLLLVIPGIWLAIRGYFAAQAVVVDGLGPSAALGRSFEIVEGSWWRTFGIAIGGGILFGVGGQIVVSLAGATGSAALYVAALMVVGAAVVSLTATLGTLLFFDLRARRAGAA